MHRERVNGIRVILICLPLNRINRLVIIIVTEALQCEVVTEFLSVV